jgi:hypothetical protein
VQPDAPAHRNTPLPADGVPQRDLWALDVQQALSGLNNTAPWHKLSLTFPDNEEYNVAANEASLIFAKTEQAGCTELPAGTLPPDTVKTVPCVELVLAVTGAWKP